MSHYHGVARYEFDINDPKCPICNADGHLTDAREAAQWYTLLDLETTKKILSDIPNCFAYGSPKSFPLLPRAGKIAVAHAYEMRDSL